MVLLWKLEELQSVSLRDENGEPGWVLGGRSKFKSKTTWSIEVIDFLLELQDILQEAVGLEFLEVYTCHKRGDQIFRGHPNFMGKGHWRDWAWVDFGKDGEFCCQMWCFILIPNMEGKRVDYGDVRLEEGTFAVVEWGTTLDAKVEVPEIRASELLVPIRKAVGFHDDGTIKDKKLCLADTKAFVAPACVLPDIGGPANRYYVVESRNQWRGFYIDWLQQDDDSLSTLESDQASDFESEEEE